MYDDLFFKRLTELRMAKNVSQREMSLSMGQSEGYITKIENRSAMPSMTAFFYICEYLQIHPKDFFNTDLQHPALISQINDDLLKMSEEQLVRLAALVKDIVKK